MTIRLTQEQLLATDLTGLTAALGDNHWNLSKTLETYAVPLDSIENCRKVCQDLQDAEDERFQAALQAWIGFSRKEVIDADSLAKAQRAYARIPRTASGRDSVELTDRELTGEAFQKCVSYETGAARISAFLQEQGHYSTYPLFALERMFEVATIAADFALVCDKCGSESSMDHKTKWLKAKALEQFKVKAAKECEGLTLPEALAASKTMPHEYRGDYFRIAITAINPDEQALRLIIASESEDYQNREKNPFIAQAKHRLDVLGLKKVEGITTRAEAVAAAASVKDSPAALGALQKVIDKEIKTNALKAQTYDDFREIYRNCSLDHIRDFAWDNLVRLADTVARGEELWKNAHANQNGYRERQALELLLRLAGDNVELVRQVFKTTSSAKALSKRLDLPLTYQQALTAWEVVRRDNEYRELQDKAFIRLIGTIEELFPALELMQSLDKRSSDYKLRRNLLGRMLEISKGKKSELVHIGRNVENQTAEMQAMIAVALLPFFPKAVEEAAVA